MDLLLALPVIVKVLGSLGLVLLLNSRFRQLSVSLGAGIVLLAAWSGHAPLSAAAIAWSRFSSLNHLLLVVITMQVIWLSSQMAASGVMRDLVSAVKSCLSQRAAMAVLPAVIGALPMPGGALFSAPLVDDCDHEASVQPVLKAQVNYWFRHVWEYWWPLYPGVLLALDITGLEVWQFMLVQLPLAGVAVLAGAWLLLGRIAPDVNRRSAPHSLFNRRFPALLSPILVVVAVYTAVRVLLPALATTSRYLPMIVAIFSAMLVLQCWRPLCGGEWLGILFTRRVLSLVILVTLVRVYGAFIEADLPSGIALVERMRIELAAWGAPVFVITMAIPFLSGLASGLALGFVGASFPIVFNLIGADAGLAQKLATLVLAYGFGYAGMLLSPVHVCLIVTNAHFATRITQSLRGLLKPVLCVLLASVLLHVLVRQLGAL